MDERGFIGWIVIGAVAGVVGKLLMPGRDPGGCIVTILLGIAGALLAGFVAQALAIDVRGGFWNYVAATAGAIVILIIYRLIVGRSRSHPPSPRI
jgi:uncharacterized membrane protein YeaQ/YmgE (transglycosylase-associated protein family)